MTLSLLLVGMSIDDAYNHFDQERGRQRRDIVPLRLPADARILAFASWQGAAEELESIESNEGIASPLITSADLPFLDLETIEIANDDAEAAGLFQQAKRRLRIDQLERCRDGFSSAETSVAACYYLNDLQDILEQMEAEGQYPTEGAEFEDAPWMLDVPMPDAGHAVHPDGNVICRYDESYFASPYMRAWLDELGVSEETDLDAHDHDRLLDLKAQLARMIVAK